MTTTTITTTVSFATAIRAALRGFDFATLKPATIFTLAGRLAGAVDPAACELSVTTGEGDADVLAVCAGRRFAVSAQHPEPPCITELCPCEDCPFPRAQALDGCMRHPGGTPDPTAEDHTDALVTVRAFVDRARRDADALEERATRQALKAGAPEDAVRIALTLPVHGAALRPSRVASELARLNVLLTRVRDSLVNAPDH